MLVPFTRNFDEDKTIVKDPDRKEKLKAEAPGILAWCVRGALAYQKAGLRPPGRVQAAKEEYRGDMDLLGEWLLECCELHADCEDTISNLWASWEQFAKSRGELRFIPSARALGRRLSQRFSRRKTDGTRMVCGLRVKTLGGI
jgi:phage/plasmid-associated DNA primase